MGLRKIMNYKSDDTYLEELMRLNNELINTQRKLQKKNEELQEANSKLEKALLEIKTLKGLLPICMRCKKIREDDGYWREIDQYFRLHSELEFSHGYCEKCFKELYPEIADDIIDEINNEKKNNI